MICARIVGLKNHPQMNGRYVRIAAPLKMVAVPEADGVVRKAKRYGFYVLDAPEISGYIKPENLEEVDYRAACIHLFGTEEEPE